jgi:competence protein ComFC
MWKALLNYAGSLTDFIFPAQCQQCDAALIAGKDFFCKECWAKLNYLKKGDNHNLVLKKFEGICHIDAAVSLFYFEENCISQKIIHLIKYSHFTRLGIMMGGFLAEQIQSIGLERDLLIPVPLHKTKKRERGFNQAEVISKGICQVLDLPLRNDILVRKKYTLSQTKLGKTERMINVSDAFILVKKAEIYKRNILLVDDVITTGSTMNECSKILKENGANKIIALSLALVKT